MLSKTFVTLCVGISACSVTSLRPDDIEPWPTDGGATDGGLADAPPPPPALATDVSVTEIALFQGVKLPLMKNGEVAKGDYASLVAGRPGLLRVYVKPAKGFRARDVIAELSLKNSAGVVTMRQAKIKVSRASLESQLDSTINFTIAPEDIAPGKFSFNVRLLDVPPEVPVDGPPAQYPSDLGYASADVSTSGGLRVVIVPVRYNADGSGRLPVTDAAAIERYKKAFFEMYPITSIDIKVRDPIDWSGEIKADRSGWTEILNELIALRAKDQPADDIYYVGTFAPASTFWGYCGNGCTAGLATLLSSTTEANMRAGVSLGYGDDYAATTAVHETGHLHGRKHAPCGNPASVDRAYPDSSGMIETWGYGILDKELYDPGSYTDFMGYCQATWVSDYTYAALLKRVQSVTPLKKTVALPGGDYRLVQVGSAAALSWGPTIRFPAAPTNNPTSVRVVDASGTHRTITGYYYPYGDDAGGVMLVRKADLNGDRIEIDINGKTQSLQ